MVGRTVNFLTLFNDLAINGDVTFSGTGTGSLRLDGPVSLAAGTHSLSSVSEGNPRFSGVISGDGGLTISGGSVEFLGSAANTYTGGTTISGGTLQIGDGGTTGSITGNVTNNAALAFNRSDNLTFGGIISGTGTLTKQGAGALTLSGTNTYSGATSVESGSLLVNGSLGNTAVSVDSGALLGGSGTIAGAVTVADGGILAPGNSAATLTVGSLTLNNSSVLNYELGDPGNPATSDRTQVNGDLTLDGILNITALTGFGDGTYRLVDYTGSLTDNGLLFGTVPTPFDLTVDTSMGGQINRADQSARRSGNAAVLGRPKHDAQWGD